MLFSATQRIGPTNACPVLPFDQQKDTPDTHPVVVFYFHFLVNNNSEPKTKGGGAYWRQRVLDTTTGQHWTKNSECYWTAGAEGRVKLTRGRVVSARTKPREQRQMLALGHERGKKQHLSTCTRRGRELSLALRRAREHASLSPSTAPSLKLYGLAYCTRGRPMPVSYSCVASAPTWTW